MTHRYAIVEVSIEEEKTGLIFRLGLVTTNGFDLKIPFDNFINLTLSSEFYL